MRQSLLVLLLVLLFAPALLALAAEDKDSQAPPPPPPAVSAETPPAKQAKTETKPPDTKPAEKLIETKPVSDEENSCIQCHANLTEKDQQRFLVTAKDLVTDTHWQKGMRCQDCHGGDPTVLEIKAHQAKDDFKAIKSPADVPEFCGKCHADIAYMRHYKPSARTDQLSEYWTSGHGRKLKAGDLKVAVCTSCHGKPHGSGADTAEHGVRAVDDLASPVYRTRLAKTCSTCHSNAELMAGRKYHDRPLGHDQYAKWRESVHGKALLEKGDLSAPTCNNCHGNHGAMPPQVDSVANACGVCHGKVAKLFGQTLMKHRFEKASLPGCATCHHAHDIMHPSDELLGMQGGAVCIRCHTGSKFGATIAGAEKARLLRVALDNLKDGIQRAEKTLAKAERLGMEVSQPRFDLRRATDSLTNARSLIHTFAVPTMEAPLATADNAKALAQALDEAKAKGDEAKARALELQLNLADALDKARAAGDDLKAAAETLHEAKAKRDEATAKRDEAKAEGDEAKAKEYEAKAEEYEAKAEEYEAKAEEYEAKAREYEAKAREYVAKAKALARDLVKAEVKALTQALNEAKAKGDEAKAKTLERQLNLAEALDRAGVAGDDLKAAAEALHEATTKRDEAQAERDEATAMRDEAKAEGDEAKVKEYEAKAREYDAEAREYDAKAKALAPDLVKAEGDNLDALTAALEKAAAKPDAAIFSALARAKDMAVALAEGDEVVLAVQTKADGALEEHTARRIWLAASLMPILLVIALLLAYIRTLPPPEPSSSKH